MKKIILMIIMITILVGCSKNLTKRDPDISKHFVRRETTLLTDEELEEVREERRAIMERFRDDEIIIGKYPSLKDDPKTKKLKSAWKELLIIHDHQLRTKHSNEVDRIREIQYRERIEELKKDWNRVEEAG